LGQILEGLGMKKVGIFYGLLEYITAIWSILGPFDNLVPIWYTFPRFGILCKEKSGNLDAIYQMTTAKLLICKISQDWSPIKIPILIGSQHVHIKSTYSWECYDSNLVFLINDKKNVRHQGCQILLGTWYQTGKNVLPKGTQNVPNGHEISQMTVKYSK
jgi:hypothetical protein